MKLFIFRFFNLVCFCFSDIFSFDQFFVFDCLVLDVKDDGEWVVSDGLKVCVYINIIWIFEV